MSNLLPDPGAELGSVTLTGLAALNSSTPRSGANAIELRTRAGLFGQPDGTSTATWPSFSVISGTRYGVTLYANSDSVSNATDLILEVDSGSGVWQLLASFPAGATTGYIATSAVYFTATGATARYRARSAASASGILNDVWLIDDVLIEAEAVVVSASIRAAVIADLEGITTANGYEITVRSVYAEPTPEEHKVFPFLELVPTEGGSADISEAGIARSGKAFQSFNIRGGVDSGQPMADQQKLVDSVRNAIEKSTSAILALSSPLVESVVVSAWSMGLAGDEIAQGGREISVDIDISYHYTRGEA